MSDTTLPFHPLTGLPAAGWRKARRGEVGDQPFWPIRGGAEDDAPDAPEADDGAEDTDDKSDGADKDKPDSKAKPEPFDPERHAAALRKKNAENVSLKRQLQELKPLADKAKELEDANKSETEKLTERLTAAEKEAGSSKSELLRLRVAMTKGLTLKQAGRLRGTTEEELEEDADELLEEIGAVKKEDTPRLKGKPKEQLRGGGDPDEEPEETDPRKLAAAIRRD